MRVRILSLLAIQFSKTERRPSMRSRAPFRALIAWSESLGQPACFKEGGVFTTAVPVSQVRCSNFLLLELHRTARGRCLDQPLRPVKPTSETARRYCLRGARLLPLIESPVKHLGDFSFVAVMHRGALLLPLVGSPRQAPKRFSFVAFGTCEGCCFYPSPGHPVKHLGDFPSSPSVLAKGAASTPSRDPASTPRSVLPLLRCVARACFLGPHCFLVKKNPENRLSVPGFLPCRGGGF
jgi:hypothetical protein